MSSVQRTSAALAGSLVVMTALSPMAWAQGVTAQELWGAWQDGVAVAGGTLSASESREGNQLVLKDLRLDLGDEAGILQLEQMRLINQADGSVAVILPDRFPLMFELPDAPGDNSDASSGPEKVFITVDAPDLTLVVQGLGERAEFQATAPKMELTLDRIVPAIPPEDGVVTANMVLDGFGLRYLQDLATDVPLIDAAISFDALNAQVAVGENASGSAEMAAKIGKSSAGFSGAMPVNSPELQAVDAGMSGGNFPVAAWLALLDAGLRGKASLALGDVEFTGDVAEISAGTAEPPTSWDIGFDKLEFALGIDAAKIGYSTLLQGTRFILKGEIPDFPADQMNYSIGEYRIGLEVGLNGLTTPQDWSAAYVMRDITMSDEMWDLISNGTELPHEPLTFALDLGGRYAVQPEMLKPGWMPGADDLPFTEFSFKINEMKLAGLGVVSNGQGGLGFDFADLTTFDGLPLPSGRISVLTSGVYGLIDLMAKAGQISEDDVRSARAALLMIGRAGEAPDTLQTEVDFRDKGLFLNGIKIR